MKCKCKYCGAEIDKTCVRYSSCDYAWQDGREASKEEIKSKLREIYNTLKTLNIICGDCNKKFELVEDK